MHRIRQMSGRTPVGPGTRPISGAHRCRSYCPPVKFQNFKISITFWNPTSRKGAFCQIVKKSRILPYKKSFFFQKGTAVKKRKKKSTLPASTADPKKVKKIDFDFCQFFLHFWLRLLDAVLMKTMFIVRNIYRIMTRNKAAVFKEESTLLSDRARARGRGGNFPKL